METGQAKNMVLGAGASRRLFLTAGSAIYVSAGQLELRGPCVWLAETLWWPERIMLPEDHWSANESGWIELRALRATAANVLFA